MNVFLNDRKRLRNGWWMLIFVALVAVTRPLYRLLSGGIKQLGIDEAWREPLPFVLALLATWVCLRLRKESMASVGFGIDRRWLRHLALGMALGAGSLLLATAMIMAIGGVTFEIDPGRSIATVGYGLYVFLFVALLEETLFRGFLFQRLVDGTGVWFAQLSLAALFAFGHWDNPGMDGLTKLLASIELGLAAMMLGLAYLRTRSLALPVGLHLAWNWVQGYVLGFGVSGVDQPGWWRPVFHGRAEWLTGGEFGPEASVFGIVADLVVIALLWRWKGLATMTTDGRAGAVAAHSSHATDPSEALAATAQP